MSTPANRLILVTGAAGFVGSHCLVELLTHGYDVVAIDNCVNAIESNSPTNLPESLRRVETITGRKLVAFYKVDINDAGQLNDIFNKHRFVAVMHFASLKAVGESCKIPLEYYRNNVGGTVALLETMRAHLVRRLIFSSSATVYGLPEYLPINEFHQTGRNCTNPYGRTKYFIEEILKDLCASETGWSITSLRYFNPVGAHESGDIGEDPQGIPNNLMPYIAQVAVGRQPYLNVFGNDFKTEDGSGVRDYIHIMDLAAGHVITLDKILQEGWLGWNVYNLGAGTGYSVLDVIAAFELSTGVSIPYQICERRNGDVDELWADISKANNKLNWKPTRSLADMCAHSWNWQSKNPMGYRSATSNGFKAINGTMTNGDKVASSNLGATKDRANGQQQIEPTNGGAIKGKAPNGKVKSFEVNNNDEEVAAYE